MTPHPLVTATSRCSGYPVSILLGPHRHPLLVRSRWAGIWVARQTIKLHLSAAARAFSRDHSTIISSEKRFKALIAREPQWLIMTSQIYQEMICPGCLPEYPPQITAEELGLPPPDPFLLAPIDRIRDLRRRGWSMPGIAGHLNLPVSIVSRTLGEPTCLI